MTHADKVKQINTLVSSYRKLDSVLDSLNASVGLDLDSPLFTVSWATFQLALTTTATLIGDKAEWLDWYIYENDCGDKGYEAGPKEAMRSIRSVEDLLWLIEK